MRRSKFVLLLYLLLVFASGVVVGALGYRTLFHGRVQALGRPSPEEFRQKFIAELNSRLHLTPQQVQQLNAILDRTRQRFEKLENEVLRPQKRLILKQQSDEIRAILDEQQRAEFDKWLEERAARRRERHAEAQQKRP